MRSPSSRHGGAFVQTLYSHPDKLVSQAATPYSQAYWGPPQVPTKLTWVRNPPGGMPSVWLLNQVLVAGPVSAGSTRHSLKPSCLCAGLALRPRVATVALGGGPRSAWGTGRRTSLSGPTLLLNHVLSCSPDLGILEQPEVASAP